MAGKSKVVPTRVNAARFGRGLTERLHALVWVPATSWIHEQQSFQIKKKKKKFYWMQTLHKHSIWKM